jgi:hypothetical protein
MGINLKTGLFIGAVITIALVLSYTIKDKMDERKMASATTKVED